MFKNTKVWWLSFIKKIIEIKNQKNFDIQEIVNIRATLNKGLSEKLKAAFPNTKEVERPLVENKVIPHPEWFAGFTSAEGCWATVRVCPDI